MKSRQIVGGLCALLAWPVTAAGQQLVHPDPTFADFYVGGSLIAALGSIDFDASGPPVGARGFDVRTPDLQEDFGASAHLGYRLSAWGVPLRAEVEGTYLYRYDVDARAYFADDTWASYKNNLGVWALSLNLLADVGRLRWASFYVGGGLGVARLDSEVWRTAALPYETADHVDWNPTGSLQAGMVLDKLSDKFSVDLGYRYQWFGDARSGRLSDDTRFYYDDFQLHQIRLGVSIPFGSR